jgi:gliding motility-associated-like protein
MSKTKLLNCFSLLLVATIFQANFAKAQIVAPDAYIKATSVEVGINGIGGYEGANTAISPPIVGMHPRSGGTGFFGFVANPHLDSWATYDGDFFTPGTPENGWGFEIGTAGINASNNCASAPWGGTPQGIPGAITSWTHNYSCYSADWQGDYTTGTNLHFKINYFLQETDLFYTTTVSITNNTAATIPDMYYYRNVDPDNNETNLSTDAFITQNTIVSEPGSGCNLAHVSATQSSPWASYLGFAAVGANWRSDYGGFSNRDASDLWTGTGFTQTVGSTAYADQAMSLAYRIQNLAPGATEIFKFVVILDNASSAAAINNLLYLTYPGSAAGTPASCTPYADTIPTCGGPVPISVTGTDVSDYTWMWSPGTGLSGTTGSSVIANPSVNTVYTVSGTPISPCSAPISFTFIVQITSPADATINAVSPICSSAPSFNMTSVSSGGTWAGTGITNGPLGTFNPAVAGGGTFTINHYIPGICGDTASILVTVLPAPTPTFVSNVNSGCAPLCVNFTESASVSCTSVSYSFGDGDTTNVSNPNHCYDTAGIYSVSIHCSAANGCVGTTTVPNMITVLPMPVADFSVTPGSTVAPGTDVNFSNLSTPGSSSSWFFGDPGSATNTSSLTSPSHTYPNEGNFCILLVSNLAVCSDTAKYCIIVIGESTIFIPNVFTPNNDGNNDLFAVGSHNMKEISYEIYDRWGLKIAEYNGLTGGWNGETKNGKMAPDGTYYYVLNATAINGKTVNQSGFISLLSNK